jgi:hypothetical protein
MNRAKVLDRRATRQTTRDIPVRTDVFLHNLDPFTLELLRRALELGLVPSSLDFAEGDDEPFAILRHGRSSARVL